MFCGPIYWFMPYGGDAIRWTCYHTLDLFDDAYRDPLLPPQSVWTHNHAIFIKELEIRKERMRKIKEKEDEANLVTVQHIEDRNKAFNEELVKIFKEDMEGIVKM